MTCRWGLTTASILIRAAAGLSVTARPTRYESVSLLDALIGVERTSTDDQFSSLTCPIFARDQYASHYNWRSAVPRAGKLLSLVQVAKVERPLSFGCNNKERWTCRLPKITHPSDRISNLNYPAAETDMVPKVVAFCPSRRQLC